MPGDVGGYLEWGGYECDADVGSIGGYGMVFPFRGGGGYGMPLVDCG